MARLKTIITNEGSIKRQFRYDACKHDDGSGWSIWTFEDEEDLRRRFLYPILAKQIDKNKLFVDVGGACGSYSLPALAFGWKVLAFCPQAEWECFQANLDLNHFNDNAVDIVKGGLYDKEGYLHTESLQFISAQLPYSILEQRAPRIEDKEIPVFTMDWFIRYYTFPHNGIDYIKIDVEGAEVQVLKGMKHTIEVYKPKNILVENHEFKSKGISQKVIDVMSEHPYTYEQPVQYHSISHTMFTLKT
jgi:FkbM family methyltransferase